MEQKVHDVLNDVLDVPVRVPALHELLATPEGPLVQPAVGIYGNCAAWGQEWVKTCEKVGGDDHELVIETSFTRKLLKVCRQA